MNKYLAADCVEGSNFKYDLYAVVRHLGGFGGWHYKAECKTQNKWYNFNDTVVTEIQEESVICNKGSDSVYVLFYKKQNNQVHGLETDVICFSDVVKERIIFPAIEFIYLDGNRGNCVPVWIRSLSDYWKPGSRADFYDDFSDVHRFYTELDNYQQVKSFVINTGMKTLTNADINEILCLQSSSTSIDSIIQHEFGAALFELILLWEGRQ